MHGGALVGRAGERELFACEAKGIGGAAFNKRHGLEHLGGGARQHDGGGIAPAFNDLAAFAANDSVAHVDALQERSTPDFGH